ncbi:hypothetical protein F5Y11DRAFT_313872 [Daldinia sp. FL1419]|nr:hypothetical protein F5Y11DRAFT_313872 [Daldinia sp. FL1419]
MGYIILTKIGLSYFPKLFNSWKATMAEENSSELERLRSKVKDLERKFKREFVMPGSVRIKALGIWDAVSALGVPLPSQIPQPTSKTYRNVHKSMPGNVDHCYHALSLGEKRKHFRPIVWKTKSDSSSSGNIKQCWFMGQHGDVGGGNPDKLWLSNLSLIWMMAHLAKTGANFDVGTLSALLDPKELWSHGESRTVGGNEDGTFSPSPFWEGKGEEEKKIVHPYFLSSRTTMNETGGDAGEQLLNDASKGRLQRVWSDLPRKLSYMFMGIQKRIPGKRSGELMHWSVRLFSMRGRTEPILQDWVMVRDGAVPSWIQEEDLLSSYKSYLRRSRDEMGKYHKIREDEIFPEEETLLKEWIWPESQMPEPEASSSDPHVKARIFLRYSIQEAREPTRLYTHPRLKPLMGEFEAMEQKSRKFYINQLPGALEAL